MMVVVFCALLGLAVGSFLNVVVWRVPRGESVVSPASACPRCETKIRPYDNVPVASWIALKGRCRDCDEPISSRYPLVEALTGVLFAFMGLRFGFDMALPAFLYLASIGVALTFIDLDTHRLPNAIVLPAYVVAPVLLLAAAAVNDEWSDFVRALVSCALLFGVYFGLMFAYPQGMGFGDVKLAGILGLYLGWVGWGALVVGAFSAFLFGGLFAVFLVLRGRAGRKSGIPFGPWMVFGALVGVGAGPELWNLYLMSFN